MIRCKGNKGITLIALVITIIIMLILAGVAISVLTSDGGLFSKTQFAADKYKNASQDEKDFIEGAVADIDNPYQSSDAKPFKLAVSRTLNTITVSSAAVSQEEMDKLEGFQFMLKPVDETRAMSVWTEVQEEPTYTFTRDDDGMEYEKAYKIGMRKVDKTGNVRVALNNFEIVEPYDESDIILDEGTVVNFEYLPETQVFTTLKSGRYKVELWGAEGGHYTHFSGAAYKFKGGYTSGEIVLNKDEKLYIYTGEAGLVTNDVNLEKQIKTTYNGGGAGEPGSETRFNGFSGGGATDIRLVALNDDNSNEFESLKSRIMVAAGAGGGAITSFYYETGTGAAGGLSGSIGTYYTGNSSGGGQGHGNRNQYGKGGTQTSGGAVGTPLFISALSAENKARGTGTFGKGGSGPTPRMSSGGGSGGGRRRLLWRWRWWTYWK